jgi:hypothetical protein
MSASRPRSRLRSPVRAAAIRADVRLTNSEGFTKRFTTWGEVSAWLASPDFLKGSAAVSSVRLLHYDAQTGRTQ